VTHALRHALAAATGTLVLGVIVSGCSGVARDGGAVGTSGQGVPVIGIEASSFFVTVENRAGQPLVNVRVAINAAGSLAPFTDTISRLESGEKRNVSMGDFRSLDGTTFSRRMRAKNIVVNAADLGGKSYEATVPWQ